jgi:hypothetical protein
MSIAYIDDLRASSEDGTYIGPARVVEMAGTTPVVELPIAGDNAPVRAEMALAFPYQPVEDDELLVMGQDGRYYVVGVLSAQGGIALRFSGDVHMHAVGGELRLSGDRGVQLHGEEITLQGKKLKVFVGSVVEKANDWYRRVRGCFNVHSGEKRELVDGDLNVRADRACTITRGVTTINGKEVHLG